MRSRPSGTSWGGARRPARRSRGQGRAATAVAGALAAAFATLAAVKSDAVSGAESRPRPPAHRVRAAGCLRGRAARAGRGAPPRRARRGRAAPRLARVRRDRRHGRADVGPTTRPLPWLTDEKHLIGEAVRAGTPVWGVCLGVQLLAASLGARVYPGPSPRSGSAGRAHARGPRRPGVRRVPRRARDAPVARRHVRPPDGAVRLARSPAYANQAFRFERAYGVQFHLEVSPEMAREWPRSPSTSRRWSARSARSRRRRSSPRSRRGADEMRAARPALFERWLDEVAT